MKKIILTVATILTLGLSFAQDCDVKTEVDSYTNERTIETDIIDFKGGVYALNKRPYGVVLWIQLESSIFLSIEKGEIIYFKMSDNSVIKFPSRKDVLSEYSSISGYTNSFGFVFDNEVLESFKNKEVIGIKCSVNEYDISKKDAIRLKNNVNCIVNIK